MKTVLLNPQNLQEGACLISSEVRSKLLQETQTCWDGNSPVLVGDNLLGVLDMNHPNEKKIVLFLPF